MSYWGFVNTCGEYALDNKGDRIGYLIRFDSILERNGWIPEAPSWSGQKREAISSKEARRILQEDYKYTADPEDVKLGIYSMSEYIKILSIDQLWEHYYKLRSYWYD